jgi:hypothetical protein
MSAVDILSDKSISICKINIRSIRNKINFLQNFVDEFDIIVLTETHLDNSIENRDIELDSFDKNPQRKDRTNSGGGLEKIYFISYTSNIDIAYGYGVIRQNIYRTQRCTRYVSRLRSRIGFNIANLFICSIYVCDLTFF